MNKVVLILFLLINICPFESAITFGWNRNIVQNLAVSKIGTITGINTETNQGYIIGEYNYIITVNYSNPSMLTFSSIPITSPFIINCFEQCWGQIDQYIYINADYGNIWRFNVKTEKYELISNNPYHSQDALSVNRDDGCLAVDETTKYIYTRLGESTQVFIDQLWYNIATPYNNRIGFACTILNQVFYVFGGLKDSDNLDTIEFLNVSIDNIFNSVWYLSKANLIREERGIRAISVPNSNVIIIVNGCYDANCYISRYSQLYNPIDDSITQMNNLPSFRNNMRSSAIYHELNKRIYIYPGPGGGTTEDGYVYSDVIPIIPTQIPTNIPSKQPIISSYISTNKPTNIPTNIPSKQPTNIPTNISSQQPTQYPNKYPTITRYPTQVTINPSETTLIPTWIPTVLTLIPSKSPFYTRNISIINNNNSLYFLIIIILLVIILCFIILIVLFCIYKAYIKSKNNINQIELNRIQSSSQVSNEAIKDNAHAKLELELKTEETIQRNGINLSDEGAGALTVEGVIINKHNKENSEDLYIDNNNVYTDGNVVTGNV